MKKIKLPLLMMACSLMGSIQISAQNWWHLSGTLNAPIVNNPVQKPGYVLVFNDEFDTPNFNDNCWKRKTGWDGGQLQFYVDNLEHIPPNSEESNYIWGDGSIKLSAHFEPVIPESAGGIINELTGIRSENASFSSASFKSREAYKHGFFEMRCKVPQGEALQPAFRLYHKDGNIQRDGQEIDIFKIFGDALDVSETNYYFNNGTNLSNYDCGTFDNNRFWFCKQQDILIDVSGGKPDFSEDFFTFGLEWRTNRLDFYINNRLVRTIEDCNVPESFSEVITDLAVSQNNGTPNPADFPADFEIDYIRIYKKIEVENFGYNANVGGWRTAEHRRLIGDINGDGKDDIVGFGASQVIVSLGRSNTIGAGFRYPSATLSNFCQAQGWSVQNHPVYLADANGDGKDDIIGFGGAGVFVALSNTPSGSTSPSFQTATLWFNNFGNDAAAGGYSVNSHPRMVGDVNGDGKADVVAFSGAGVRVAFSNGSGFTSNGQVLIPNYGSDANAGGWNTTDHRRFVADINNDGKDDIVGLGGSKVIIAKSLGTSFAASQLSISEFCTAQGWTKTKHPIYMADVNADGRKDIVGFFNDGVRVAHAQSTFGFFTPTLWLGSFGYNNSAGAWRTDKHIRLLGDINGDGRDDIVGYGKNGVYIALAGLRFPAKNSLNFAEPELVFKEFGYDPINNSCMDSWYGNWRIDKHPRTLGDYNGDGNLDFIAFGNEGVFAHVSSFGCDQSNPHRLKSPNVYDDQESSFSIYPNPSNGELRLQLENETNGNLQVFDVNARLVMERDFVESQQFLLDLSQETKGVYFIRVSTPNSIKTEKIILQ